MSKYSTISRTVFVYISLVAGVTAQSKVAQFTGLWVLDKEKTNTTKDFPERLKDFKMLVGEDRDRLMVKSQVDGPVEVRLKSPGTFRGVVTSYGGTMALFFTPPEITYDLSGKEIKIEPGPGD